MEFLDFPLGWEYCMKELHHLPNHVNTNRYSKFVVLFSCFVRLSLSSQKKSFVRLYLKFKTDYKIKFISKNGVFEAFEVIN